MKMVQFKVLELIDDVKQGSELLVGAVLATPESEVINDRLYYTAKNEIEYLFYIGDTCELVRADDDQPLPITSTQ